MSNRRHSKRPHRADHRNSGARDDAPRDHDAGQQSDGGATGAQPKQVPAPSPSKPLPQWRVILHNDDVNTFEDVIESIVMIMPLNQGEATLRTKLAHESGTALLLSTHRERAELYVQQLASRNLTATAEPDK